MSLSLPAPAECRHALKQIVALILERHLGSSAGGKRKHTDKSRGDHVVDLRLPALEFILQVALADYSPSVPRRSLDHPTLSSSRQAPAVLTGACD
jgi:hypothetical protein